MITTPGTATRNNDLLCFSHLRWNFVFQRPQHLLSRFARFRRVFFFEEPEYDGSTVPTLNLTNAKEGVIVATPILPLGLSEEEKTENLNSLLKQLISEADIENPTAWYYTPYALKFSKDLAVDVTIYDCMDELSLFHAAPPELLRLERDLMSRADLVFTGGYSLFEAKRHAHKNVHPVPSSIDFGHFSKARLKQAEEPSDQAKIPGPRIGYFGVIDERLDLELIDKVAALRPHWQIIMVGPVVKISAESLPKRANIHYLGKKSYQELPTYIAGWTAAIMPFARNDATRFISPTKTPEYLAAGRPVVSTSIRDVIRPYGQSGLVEIADNAHDFVSAIERTTRRAFASQQWIREVDQFLAHNSWDQTFERMAGLEQAVAESRAASETIVGEEQLELLSSRAKSAGDGMSLRR